MYFETVRDAFPWYANELNYLFYHKWFCLSNLAIASSLSLLENTENHNDEGPKTRPFSDPRALLLHSSAVLFWPLSSSYNCLGFGPDWGRHYSRSQPQLLVPLTPAQKYTHKSAVPVSVASFWRYLCVEISTVHVKFLVFLYIIRLALAARLLSL